MTKFNDEMYEKGYNDGYADALNNLELVDILEHIQDFSDEDKQKIIDELFVGNLNGYEEYTAIAVL